MFIVRFRGLCHTSKFVFSERCGASFVFRQFSGLSWKRSLVYLQGPQVHTVSVGSTSYAGRVKQVVIVSGLHVAGLKNVMLGTP